MVKKKNLVIIVIILLVVAVVSYFIYSQNKKTKDFIENDQNKWNLSLLQNTTVSGNMMGFFYDNNFDINNLPEEYVTFLLTEYYIQNSGDFFSNENHLEDATYQKMVSYSELVKYLHKMFGPDYKETSFNKMSYGCGRSLLQDINGNLLISANDPEACGIFDDTKEQYISHVTDYFKKDDKIIVNMKVGFISSVNDRIALYSNKNKAVVLDFDYKSNCLGSIDEACYKMFGNYQITLKKASDNNYYFYSIVKA